MRKRTSIPILHLDESFGYAFRVQMTLKDFDQRFHIDHEASLRHGEFRVARNGYALILLSDRLSDLNNWDLAATRLRSHQDTPILLLSDAKKLPAKRKSYVNAVFRKCLLDGTAPEDLRQWQMFQSYLVSSLAHAA